MGAVRRRDLAAWDDICTLIAFLEAHGTAAS